MMNITICQELKRLCNSLNQIQINWKLEIPRLCTSFGMYICIARTCNILLEACN